MLEKKGISRMRSETTSGGSGQTAEHLGTRVRKRGEGRESQKRKRRRRRGWWPVYAVTELPEAAG